MREEQPSPFFEGWPLSRRRSLQALAGAALAAGGVGVWRPARAQGGPPPSEAKAPPLPEPGTVLRLPPVTLLDGRPFTPDPSRPLVLYWWASTCPFCALQSPEMQKLWAQHSPRGLQMLALSIDKKPEDALAYLQKRGYTFPSAWVTPAFAAALPKPKGLPITLVLDGSGKVLQAEKGQMFAEDVQQLARWF